MSFPSPFIKVGDLSFQNFHFFFSIFFKGGIIYFYTNTFQCYLFLSVWCLCFVYFHHFCQYYLSFTGRTYCFYKWIIIGKKMHCKKQTFGTSDLFIHCNKHSCSEHITGGVNIFLYGCVSLMLLECCVFVCVCDIESQYQQKTRHQ